MSPNTISILKEFCVGDYFWKISPPLVQGKANLLADCFSRLPRMDPPSEGKSPGPRKGAEIDFATLQTPDPTDDIDIGHGACRFNQEMFESFLNYPDVAEMQNPMELDRIQQHQNADQELNQMRQRRPDRFPVKCITGRPLICCRIDANVPEGDWRVCLPVALLDDVVAWCHRVLGHGGIARLCDTIRTHCCHPELKRKCEVFTCAHCQRDKVLGAGHGELPSREAPLAPWDEVAVDLVGPWTITVQNADVKFFALTCIDPVADLTKLIRIENKTSAHVSQQFQNCWLARHPRPNRCVHDNGREFTGWEFQRLLQQAAIQPVSIASCNPQANATCDACLNMPQSSTKPREMLCIATLRNQSRFGPPSQIFRMNFRRLRWMMEPMSGIWFRLVSPASPTRPHTGPVHLFFTRKTPRHFQIVSLPGVLLFLHIQATAMAHGANVNSDSSESAIHDQHIAQLDGSSCGPILPFSGPTPAAT